MVHREGNTIVVKGAVTIRNVVELMRQGVAYIEDNAVGSHLQIDLHQISEVDSTAISMLFEWYRAANNNGCELEVTHMPASLESLVQLYDVSDIVTPGAGRQ
ncbi:STAS domain-containing protein [Nitrosomonas marina]|uniref:Phospholipid transport system transporter-binding protein n=1 Tax=Nitrosomonas marina TaxID=917 RepID=A0A1H8B7E6_9PROT|nr:STAS domain-containing protein [Nitrosomonas marina]SEM78269.1 phospholipid transport system transporter-binding protein [Nitrosomonas marina]